MKKALLIIGDRKTDSRHLALSFKTFLKHIRILKKNSLELHITNYFEVLEGNLPEVSSNALTIMFFFPFQYWNKNIEVYKKDSRIYGDIKFGKEYKEFLDKVQRIIKSKYKNKRIKYINPPESSILERDKKKTKDLFKRHNIPTPKSFKARSPKAINRLISEGNSLYIKPRFGSMGKGVTYINKDLMITNFLFKKGKIISRPYDYNWKFLSVRRNNRNRYLNKLLYDGVITEEAIDPAVSNGRRFDFRVYCIYGKIVYYYARSSMTGSCVTNWSQGGEIEKKVKFSKYIPEEQTKKVKLLARRVAKKLHLNYAGIDIIFSKGFKKAYVLEAHSFPGFERGFDLMGYLAGEILKN